MKNWPAWWKTEEAFLTLRTRLRSSIWNRYDNKVSMTQSNHSSILSNDSKTFSRLRPAFPPIKQIIRKTRRCMRAFLLGDGLLPKLSWIIRCFTYQLMAGSVCWKWRQIMRTSFSPAVKTGNTENEVPEKRHIWKDIERISCWQMIIWLIIDTLALLFGWILSRIDWPLGDSYFQRPGFHHDIGSKLQFTSNRYIFTSYRL